MISNTTLRNTINFLAFQGMWFLCVLRTDLFAAGLTLAAVGLHLLFISQNRIVEGRFIIMAAVLGVGLDTLWQNLGVLRFPENDGAYAEGLIPGWLMTIWLAFATTLGHSLAWIRRHRYLPWLFAPIAGPFAYWGAAALGPVEIGYGYWGLLALALGWALVFPLQLRILAWLEHTQRPIDANPS